MDRSAHWRLSGISSTAPGRTRYNARKGKKGKKTMEELIRAIERNPEGFRRAMELDESAEAAVVVHFSEPDEEAEAMPFHVSFSRRPDVPHSGR